MKRCPKTNLSYWICLHGDSPEPRRSGKTSFSIGQMYPRTSPPEEGSETLEREIPGPGVDCVQEERE